MPYCIFSSACVAGFNFGVIRYCLSPYPESPRIHPLAFLVSSIWNNAELQNMKESCTDPGHLQTIFVNLKKRRFVSTNIYLGYLLPLSCTQLFIINKSISPYRRYLTTLIFIKFIELCIPFAVLGLYSNNVEAKTRKSKRDVMFGLKVRLIPSLCIEVPVPSQWSCNCICV